MNRPVIDRFRLQRPMRGFTGIIDPLGHRVTYSDQVGRLTGFEDGAGKRVTLGYTTLPDRTSRLSSRESGTDQTQTLFDVNGRVSSQIDALGHRTTFVWDTDGRHDDAP